MGNDNGEVPPRRSKGRRDDVSSPPKVDGGSWKTVAQPEMEDGAVGWLRGGNDQATVGNSGGRSGQGGRGRRPVRIALSFYMRRPRRLAPPPVSTNGKPAWADSETHNRAPCEGKPRI
jgi:hypothetical protein